MRHAVHRGAVRALASDPIQSVVRRKDSALQAPLLAVGKRSSRRAPSQSAAARSKCTDVRRPTEDAATGALATAGAQNSSSGCGEEQEDSTNLSLAHSPHLVLPHWLNAGAWRAVSPLDIATAPIAEHLPTDWRESV